MAFHQVDRELPKTGSARGGMHVDQDKAAAWFHDYLRSQGVTAEDLGKPLTDIEFPAREMYVPSYPRDADPPTRRKMYWAAKFGHWWSAKQLRFITDLIQELLPDVKVSTLPSSHSFFHGGKPYRIGMSYRMLDLFELGEQDALDRSLRSSLLFLHALQPLLEMAHGPAKILQFFSHMVDHFGQLLGLTTHGVHDFLDMTIRIPQFTRFRPVFPFQLFHPLLGPLLHLVRDIPAAVARHQTRCARISFQTQCLARHAQSALHFRTNRHVMHVLPKCLHQKAIAAVARHSVPFGPIDRR